MKEQNFENNEKIKLNFEKNKYLFKLYIYLVTSHDKIIFKCKFFGYSRD